MKKYHDYRLVSESWESQCSAGRHNPATVLKTKYKGEKRRFVLGCGDADTVDVFIEGNLLFVVNVNHGLEYAGLTVFDLVEGVEIGEAYVQYDWEVEETLGPRGVDLSPMTIAKRLADYALA